MTEKLYTVRLEDLRKAFRDVFAESDVSVKGGPGSGPQGGGGNTGHGGSSPGGRGDKEAREAAAKLRDHIDRKLREGKVAPEVHQGISDALDAIHQISGGEGLKAAKGGPGSGPQGGGGGNTGHGGREGERGGSSPGRGGGRDSPENPAAEKPIAHDSKVTDKEAREVVDHLKDEMRQENPKLIAATEFTRVESTKPTSSIYSQEYDVHYTQNAGKENERQGSEHVGRTQDGKLLWEG